MVSFRKRIWVGFGFCVRDFTSKLILDIFAGLESWMKVSLGNHGSEELER